MHAHRYQAHPPLQFEPLEPALVRGYVARARQHVPVVPDRLREYIVKAYVELRRQDSRNFVVTARTLMCVLRLAQALARLRFSNEVDQPEVDEALRMLKMARASLEPDAGHRRPAADVTTAIYHVIRDAADERQESAVRLVDVLDTIRLRGTDAQLQQCLMSISVLVCGRLRPHAILSPCRIEGRGIESCCGAKGVRCCLRFCNCDYSQHNNNKRRGLRTCLLFC